MLFIAIFTRFNRGSTVGLLTLRAARAMHDFISRARGSRFKAILTRGKKRLCRCDCIVFIKSMRKQPDSLDDSLVLSTLL